MPEQDGFFSLGEMIAGGGIDREGAFLEGLDTGSRIQARRATTTNALAQARLRVDEQEANEGLADAIEAIGGPREMAVAIRAGANPEQITGSMLDRQEIGFRDSIADVGIPFEQRQASAQAVQGTVADPFQIAGGLFADVFNPGAAPQVAPESAVDSAATEALTQQRTAAALLSDERRLHPDRFKSSTTVNLNGMPLAEEILGSDPPISIIPDEFNAEEAFGAESFVKGAANGLLDFIGLGAPFEDNARATTVMNELSARTQIMLRVDVPGGRIPIMVQQLLERYAEDPTQLFRGDELARENLRSTVTHLTRALQRTKDQINSPTTKTPTKMGKLEDALFGLTDIVADYEAILRSLDGKATRLADDGGTPGVTQTQSGGSFTVDEE